MAAIEFRDPRLPEKFWSKVTPDPESGCWNWTAAADRHGYGRTGSSRTDGTRLSHRHAYIKLVGEIAVGLVLDHLCRNPRCCNPAHLEPVTQRVNIQRSPFIGVMREFPSCCPNGHEFTPENTLYKKATNRFSEPTRWRICKTCNRQQCSRYGKRRKARK